MSPKTIVSAPQKARPFFDRKVRKEGATRTLSLGKVIPKEWKYVRIAIKAQSPTEVILSVTKLYGEANNAQTKTADTHDK